MVIGILFEDIPDTIKNQLLSFAIPNTEEYIDDFNLVLTENPDSVIQIAQENNLQIIDEIEFSFVFNKFYIPEEIEKFVSNYIISLVIDGQIDTISYELVKPIISAYVEYKKGSLKGALLTLSPKFSFRWEITKIATTEGYIEIRVTFPDGNSFIANVKIPLSSKQIIKFQQIEDNEIEKYIQLVNHTDTLTFSQIVDTIRTLYQAGILQEAILENVNS